VVCDNLPFVLSSMSQIDLYIIAISMFCMLKILIRAISTSIDMGSWEEQVRQFLLDEEEDDDELFFVILPAIIPYLSEEKEPIHTSSLTGAKKG
jgi:hypothetical protein